MPLAVGSTTVVIALTFAVPAVLAAVLPIRARWIIALGFVLAAAQSLATISADEDPEDLGLAGTALVMLWLFLVWAAGVAAGRLLARTLGSRR